MNLKKKLEKMDSSIITYCKHTGLSFGRVAIFIIFFWFGLLKVFAMSPANPLVAHLLEQTLPFITFDQFIVFFGFFEMLIGVLFLLPKAGRVAILLLALHMVTTFMPLILLPEVAWQSAFVPTLEGQYIIKNIAIIALAMVIASHMRPMKR